MAKKGEKVGKPAEKEGNVKFAIECLNYTQESLVIRY